LHLLDMTSDKENLFADVNLLLFGVI